MYFRADGRADDVEGAAYGGGGGGSQRFGGAFTASMARSLAEFEPACF